METKTKMKLRQSLTPNISPNHGSPINQPPFKNPVIISRICSFLDLPSLKVVRSLNSVWLRESRPHFLPLTRVTLLPSASDDLVKWRTRLTQYEGRVGGWGHPNFVINNNAFSVSNLSFNYEEQMIGFVTRWVGQIRSLELTVKLKKRDDFGFLLSILRALGDGVLEELTLCVGITKGNYSPDDLGPLESLPCLKSLRSLHVSVPPGCHWPLPSININPGQRPEWEPREDFAGKLLTMFPGIETLRLGDDCQTLSLNLEYLAILAQIRGSKNTKSNPPPIPPTKPEMEETETSSTTTPLLQLIPDENKIRQSPEIISSSSPSNNYFSNLNSLHLLISHSHMLIHLLTLDLPLQKLSLCLGVQQNTPPDWGVVLASLESLLDKHSSTLTYLVLDQRGVPLPDWNIWRISLPQSPRLKIIGIQSNCADPSGTPQNVEETKGRIRVQDLFRMGCTPLQQTLPALTRVDFGSNGGIYSREIFDRLFPEEGVVSFSQIGSITLSLPRSEVNLLLGSNSEREAGVDPGELSFCHQRLRNIFPNANQNLWRV